MPDGYPDLEDAHVHSAAVACDADVLVTNDKKLLEFSASKGRELLPYDTMNADYFLMQFVEYAPAGLFVEVFRRQEVYWEKKCGEEGVDLPRKLDEVGAPEFAKYLRNVVVPQLLREERAA